jgi:hypothetical protein
VTASLLASLTTITGLVLLLSTPANSKRSPIEKVTAAQKTLILHEHGQKHAYRFEDRELVMYVVGEVKLISQSRVDGSLYVVLDARGPSRGSAMGQCGAGEEEYLVWLKLDDKWELLDKKLELIASCFSTIESREEEPYEIHEGKLTADYINYSEKVQAHLNYDFAKPEKGWEIHHSPLPDK